MQTTKTQRTDGRRYRLFTLAAFAGAAGLGAAAPAADIDELVVVATPYHEDFYGAGRVVRVESAVDGDIVVAGNVVDIGGPVTGDILAVGETVTLRGPLQDDVRAAGRRITLTGEVGDHALLAGETVTLSSSSRVNRYARLAGRTVEASGTVGDDLTAVGEAVHIAGTIAGDVWIDADRITLGDNTRIGGDISWPAGHAPVIPSSARIAGRQIERAAPPKAGWFAGFVGSTLFGTIALMVLTATLAATLRPWIFGATAERARPGSAVGVGLLTLVVAPVVTVLALTTVIGSPVGVALLLSYLLLLLLSVPVALLELIEQALASRGGWAKASLGRRLGAIAVASLSFVLMLAVPWLGILAGLGMLALGLGILVLRLARRSQATR